ncbi:MAG: alpha/beta hydrolase [Acidimicrobiia bacterium]|jgi:glycerol-3-phosphate dehydrogenase
MSEYLDLSRGPIHWKDYGGSGPSLVMVHGLGGSIANWDVVGPRIAQHGRATALDLPGFGLSPPADDWELETHRDVIIEFVETMGDDAVLVGNSMGGLLAEMVAAHRPDLIRSMVLVAPATPPRFPDPLINWPMASRLLIGSTPGLGTALNKQVIASMSPEELVYETMARIVHKPGRVPLSLMEEFIAVAKKRQHLPWAGDAVPKTGQSIRRFFSRPSRFVSMVRDIKAPTLVVQGIADPIVSPTSVAWVCSLRPDWKLVQMEDTGHTPQIDAPVRFMGVVAPWLRAHLEQEISA